MQALSPADQIFLWLEKRQQPMHVGGLHIYTFPEGAKSSYTTRMAEFMRTFTAPTRPFNQRLAKSFGQYYWEEDEQFDLEHHFRHIALPKPGRIRELLATVSALHSQLMDREMPLWNTYLIEGIQGRKFAMYTKAHHCMLDGVAAMRMTEKLYSRDPNEMNMPPVWALKPKRQKKGSVEPGDIVQSLAHFLSGAGKQVATIPTLVREVRRTVKRARKDPDMAGLFNAPPSILNQKITGSRRFAAESYEIERFQRLGKKLEATLNDIVLAVCGSALRNYLLSQDALPKNPLIAMVPVSIRRDDSDSGNQVAMILANLATHISDPVHRLEIVRKSVKDAKEMFRKISPEGAVNYTALTLAPTGLHLMTGLAPQWQAFNVVISNVPGPTEDRYWNGARVEGLYPVSIPVDYVALNITLVSYSNLLEFGFTACRRSLPSMQRLLDFIREGVEELERAAGV